MKITPSTKTAASAISHSIPIPQLAVTVNAKYAFSPMPGAKAKGRLAHRPIITHPTNAAIAVANNASLKGIPETESISGLTNKMYAIVRNVVTPALISPSTVLPAFVIPKVSSRKSPVPAAGSPTAGGASISEPSSPPFSISSSLMVFTPKEIDERIVY